MIDNYFGGSFLIFAGIKFRISPVKYIRLLAIAWAVLTGGFYYSIAAAQASAVEPSGHSSVLVIKIILVLVIMFNLIRRMRWKPEGNELV